MEALASRSNWTLEALAFVEGGKPENPEKNPRSKARTNNKLNWHMRPPVRESNPGHRGGRRALKPGSHYDGLFRCLTSYP